MTVIDMLMVEPLPEQLFLLFSLNPATSPTKSPTRSPTNQPTESPVALTSFACRFDLVFVVDDSGSINAGGTNNFDDVKTFITLLIGQYNVVNNVPLSNSSGQTVRFGMVLFSSTVRVVFGVGVYDNRADAIDKFVYFWQYFAYHNGFVFQSE